MVLNFEHWTHGIRMLYCYVLLANMHEIVHYPVSTDIAVMN